MPRAHWLGVTLALYSTWALATYLLVGRQRRRQPAGASSGYQARLLSVDLLLGIVVPVALLLWMRRFDFVTLEQVGLRPMFRSLTFAATGLVAGTAIFMLQRPPTLNRTVVCNAFCQVLPVSIGLVLVCWTTAGGAIEASLPDGWLAVLLAGLGASVLFGGHQIVRDPRPAGQHAVRQLALIGTLTSLFFYATRDIYGTIVFHNMFATVGVMRALSQNDRLPVLQRLRPRLLGSALLSVAVLIVAHMGLIAVS